MAQVVSNKSTKLLKGFADFFQPTLVSIILSSSLAFSIIAAGGAYAAYSYWANDSTLEVGEYLADMTFTLNKYLSPELITTAIVWALIGSGVYLFLWFIVNLVVDSYNNVLVSSSFVHPKSFHKSSFWIAIAIRSGLRIVSATLLMAAFYVIITTTIPHVGTLLDTIWSSKEPIRILKSVLTVILLCFVSLHIVLVLMRALLLRKRLS